MRSPRSRRDGIQVEVGDRETSLSNFTTDARQQPATRVPTPAAAAAAATAVRRALSGRRRGRSRGDGIEESQVTDRESPDIVVELKGRRQVSEGLQVASLRQSLQQRSSGHWFRTATAAVLLALGFEGKGFGHEVEV